MEVGLLLVVSGHDIVLPVDCLRERTRQQRENTLLL